MKYLSDYVQESQTQLFKEMGVIFAFSNKQFEEQRNHDVIYVHAGAGTLVPKENYKPFICALDAIIAKGIEQDIEENGKQAIISRELYNYECFYTGDIQDCVDALEDYGITKSEIAEQYHHILANVDAIE